MVTPYFTQHRPPALVAMLPPIEQISYDDGSGGYQRSCSAAAAFTWAFISPGCTTAVRVTGSMSIVVIRSVETTRQPSTADAPPDSPLPAPRGTTGRSLAAANRTAACTSSVDPDPHHRQRDARVGVVGAVPAVLVHPLRVGDDHVLTELRDERPEVDLHCSSHVGKTDSLRAKKPPRRSHRG